MICATLDELNSPGPSVSLGSDDLFDPVTSRTAPLHQALHSPCQPDTKKHTHSHHKRIRNSVLKFFLIIASVDGIFSAIIVPLPHLLFLVIQGRAMTQVTPNPWGHVLR